MDVVANFFDWHCNGRKALYPASLPLLLQYNSIRKKTKLVVFLKLAKASTGHMGAWRSSVEETGAAGSNFPLGSKGKKINLSNSHLDIF